MSNVNKLPDSYDKRIWVKYKGNQIYDKKAFPLSLGAVDHSNGGMSNKKGAGESIVLNNTHERPFESFKMFGKSVQEKTSGKNLLKSYVDGIASNIYSVALKVDAELKPNTTYTLSFAGCKGYSFYTNEYISDQVYFNPSADHSKVTFTTKDANALIPDDEQGYGLLKNAVDNPAKPVFTNVQLEEGTVATDYEPYCGGIPSPSPEYPQPIVSAGQKLENGIVSDVGISKKLTGKNLLKNTSKGQVANGVTCTVNDDGSITLNGTTNAKSWFGVNDEGFTFKAGQKYILNGTPKGSNSSKYYLYANGYHTNDYGEGCEIVYETDTKTPIGIYVNAGITLDNVTFKPMISYEGGDYEPYTEQTLELNRVLHGIPTTDSSMATYTDENGQMWCADYIDVDKKVLVQKCKYTVIPLSSFRKTVKTNTVNYQISLSAKYTGIGGTNQSRYAYCSICNKYLYDTADRVHWYVDQSINIFVDKQYESVVDEMDSITVCYPLATPIETPLTDEEIRAYKELHSNKPTTVITNDAGCFMEVESLDDYKHTSDYMPIHDLQNKYITLNCTPSKKEAGVAFYDSEKAYISGSHETPVIVPTNAVYMRLTVNPTDEEIMLSEGLEVQPYEPYTGRNVVYDGSNNYRFLNINEQAIEDVKADAQAIFDALDIQKASGRTLDLYGDMVGQKRGALNDAQYRIMILTRIGMNVAQGNYSTVIESAKRIFECDASDIILKDGAEPCVVTIEKFPLDVLINAGFSSTQAVELLEMLLPIGVRIDNANFSGTFEFADTADVYDEAAGFGNVEQTIGGYLGLLMGDDANRPVLPL